MKHLSNLKFMAMALFVAMLSLSFTACSSDDDDEISGITDYYFTCTVKGGGLSSQELNTLQSEINAELSSYYIEAAEYAEAIYLFDSIVEGVQETFQDGIPGINGTLTITLQLKTKDGRTAKSSSVKVTNDNSYIG